MTTTNSKRLEMKIRSTFAFKSLPFSKNLEADQLFAAPHVVRALDRLRYLVDRRGIGAIFAAPGTGKSTLLRAFMASLGKATHAVCYLAHTSCAALDLHRQIARGFLLEPGFRRADVMKATKDQLLKLSRTKKIRPVLILDEAHLLPSGFLDEVRILANFDADGRDEMTIILAGQPQLESNLGLATNEAFAQRIVSKVRLRSFHPDEVAHYLDFRLELAGRTAPLFLPQAVEAITRGSRGVARLIDRIAEQSLIAAVENNVKEIDAELVTLAIDEVDP